MRNTRASALANPVLVGAVTVLVTVVAVFLAYNANNGLPFVPTKSLRIQVPNGAMLVKGNEVRTGGFRIGVIEAEKPVRMPDGQVGAEFLLKLDEKIGDIPTDSTFKVRPRSALGLKYVEMTEGSAPESFEDGDTVPVDQAIVPVDLDEFYEMFDEKTREASQHALEGFGDGFAYRGPDLGRTIEQLRPLFTHLEPVMRNLAAPATELDEFFAELGDAARVVAPVSKLNAAQFTYMADTFAAIGRDEDALKETISKSPPTMDVAIDSFRVQRPFLNEFAAFSRDFAGATRELRGALPTVNRALVKGTPVQRRAVELNEDLRDALASLEDLTSEPTTNTAIRALTATVTSLNPQLRFYGPFITVCNSWNYFFTYLGEHFDEPDISGTSQRALLNTAGRQDNSLGSMGAKRPANGENVQEGNAQYLQGQGWMHAVMPDGTADCENGQRGYVHRIAKFFPPEYKIALDPDTPGAQGPTYTGKARVPEGQTFTREPETGLSSKLDEGTSN
jgi:ABC-type transporter Mla subunit MlaD